MAIIVLACFTDCECKKSILEGIKKQLRFGSEVYCTCAESDPSAHTLKHNHRSYWTIHISKVKITEPLSWTSVKNQTITWSYSCLWQPITEYTRQVLVPTANHNARRPCHIQLYMYPQLPSTVVKTFSICQSQRTIAWYQTKYEQPFHAHVTN